MYGSKWSTLQANCRKVHFFPPLLTYGSKGPIYKLNVEKCSFWHHMCDMAANGPQYKLNVAKCTFWHYFRHFGTILAVGHKWSAIQTDWVKVNFLAALWHLATTSWLVKSAVFGTTLSVGHQMVACTVCFWPHLVTGPPDVPTIGWLVKRAVFSPLLSLGHQMFPHT